AKGAIAAVSSDMESFGMTIVEAMHCGVPVIAPTAPPKSSTTTPTDSSSTSTAEPTATPPPSTTS
ncbi:glycosyltransferase, partial [Streptomyces sp. NPDC059271]|uniref:glycosyltransferase n=1 Tax=Streptomyces sp. NPDC059271 TaxID=3346799 RepID=UPI00368C3750